MSVLPVFPEFTPLQLGHAAIVAQFTKQFPPYADYTFVSLYSWNTRGVVALSTLNENLVVRFSDETTDDIYLSFLGKHELEKTTDTLLKFAHKQNYNPNLCLIPQAVIRSMSPELRTKYLILADRNNHDYILSVDALCQFETSLYKQRKANYKKFVRLYGKRVTCGVIDLASPGMTKEIEALFSDWRQVRKKPKRATHNEFLAIRRCLKHSQRLGVQAYGTYVDAKLVAINLFDISGDVAIGHFIKANTSYRGVTDHLVHMFARYLKTKGVTSINIQQDMGIEGLRAYKLSYRPSRFFRKYTISSQTLY